MNRRLNLRFVLIFLGILLAVGALVHWAHVRQRPRLAEALRWQAQRFDADGDPPQAAKYLARYLEFEPSDLDAQVRLAELLDELGRPANDRRRVRALLIYEHVLREDPRRDDVRRRLIPLAMELDRCADALVRLGELKQHCPGEGKLHLLEGQCLERTRQYEAARTAYQQAIRLAPELLDSYVHLARLWRKHWDQPAQADALMDQMCQANRQSGFAFLARAKYRDELGQRAESAADAAQALTLAPHDADVLLAAAELAQRRSQHARQQGDHTLADQELEHAREYLATGCRLHPGHADLQQARAALELSVGQPQRAAKQLRLALQHVTRRDDRNNLHWTLAGALIQLDRLDEAAQVIAGLEKSGYPRLAVDYLKARVLVQKRRWAEAVRELERVRALAANWPEIITQVDLYLGQCYQQLDDPDQQLDAYRRVLARDGSSVAARYGVATALAGMGRIEQALAEYQKLAQLPAAPPGIDLAIARLAIAHNRRLPPERQNWRRVEQALERAESSAAAEVAVLRAEALVAQDQLDQARDLLEARRQAQPDQVELWTALAAVLDRQGQADRALAILDEAGQRLGDRMELRLARARHWADRRGTAEPLDPLGEGLDRFSADQQRQLLRALTDAAYRLGDSERARRLAARLAEQDPHDAYIRSVLFDLAVRSGHEAEAQRWQKELWRLDLSRGTLAQARLHLWRARRGQADQLEQARKLLDELLARRPAWTPAVLCKAELDEIHGDREQALAQYQLAFDELGERHPYGVLRLLELQRACNRSAQAHHTIQKLVQENCLPPEAIALAAEVCVQVKDAPLAIELARRAVPPSCDDARRLLWRGRILADLEHWPQAEKDLRRVVELEPKLAEAWLTLVRCLVQAGQMERAHDAVQQASGRLPAREAALALAQCHELVRDEKEARACYQAALAVQPDDVATLRSAADFFLRTGPPDEAVPLLRKLGESSVEASAAEAAWARRHLALILAAAGDLARFTEALALLDQNLQAEPRSAADLRARASVLATQKNRRLGQSTARLEAIRILEDLLAKKQALSQDQFLLARLYEAEGESSKARSTMLALLGVEKNPAYLAYYVNRLLEQRQIADAVFWFQALKKQDPHSFRTIELQARLGEAQDRTDEVIALLSAGRTAPREPVSEEEAARAEEARLRFVAGLLDDLSRRAARRKKSAAARQYALAAETAFRRYLEQKPEDIAGFVVFLGRQGRLAEALSMCEAAREKNPEQATLLALAALRARSPTGALPAEERDLARKVQAWLRDIQRQQPDRVAFLLHQADLCDLQGQYAEAEKFYRQVLDRDDRNVVALNNLAWLIAQRGGDRREALRLINRAIDLAGPHGELLDTRALVQLTMEKSDHEVLADLQEAVRQTPTPSRYLHLARARQLAQDRAAASRALHQEAANDRIEPDDLHPLERPAYERLLADLQR
jgi:tetratricopeptide (TPR) repeat protein